MAKVLLSNEALIVSIPKRVLEVLKRNAVCMIRFEVCVSIPKRVLEVLKLGDWLWG